MLSSWYLPVRNHQCEKNRDGGRFRIGPRFIGASDRVHITESRSFLFPAHPLSCRVNPFKVATEAGAAFLISHHLSGIIRFGNYKRSYTLRATCFPLMNVYHINLPGGSYEKIFTNAAHGINCLNLLRARMSFFLEFPRNQDSIPGDGESCSYDRAW